MFWQIVKVSIADGSIQQLNKKIQSSRHFHLIQCVSNISPLDDVPISYRLNPPFNKYVESKRHFHLIQCVSNISPLDNVPISYRRNPPFNKYVESKRHFHLIQ